MTDKRYLEIEARKIARRGRLTMQVSHFLDVLSGKHDWFVLLHESGAPICGKQGGLSYLTRKGFEGITPIMKPVFSNRHGYTWEDMERHAEVHFAKVEAARLAKIEDLQHSITLATQKIQQLEDKK